MSVAESHPKKEFEMTKLIKAPGLILPRDTADHSWQMVKGIMPGASLGFMTSPSADLPTFIGANVQTTGSSVISFPAGTVAGDLAMFTMLGSASPTFNTATRIVTNAPIGSGSFGYVVNVWYKLLSSGDISSPPTYGSNAVQTLVWRGGAAIALKVGPTTGAGTGTTVSVTGFTKAAGSKFVIATAYDRDTNGLTGGMSAGIGFTNPDSPHGAAGPDKLLMFATNPSYVDGTTVTWSGLDSGTADNSAALFEIT
jgi:hypothetical protein